MSGEFVLVEKFLREQDEILTYTCLIDVTNQQFVIRDVWRFSKRTEEIFCDTVRPIEYKHKGQPETCYGLCYNTQVDKEEIIDLPYSKFIKLNEFLAETCVLLPEKYNTYQTKAKASAILMNTGGKRKKFIRSQQQNLYLIN